MADPSLLECIPTLKSEGKTCADGHVQRCECCESITGVFKQWLSPNEPCSILRRILRPFFDTAFYQRYKNCKIERLSLLIALISAIIYTWSFIKAPWRCELEECLGGVCSEGYKSLLLYLFVRGVVLNANGLIFSVGMFYGILAGNADFVYLWLLWKTVVVIMGAFSLGLTFILSYAIDENVRAPLALEAAFLFANFITWVIVYAYYEQVCPCLMAPGDEEEEGEAELEGEEGGGGADDEAMDEGGGFIMREYIIPGSRMSQLSGMTMGSVLPTHGTGTTVYTLPGSQQQQFPSLQNYAQPRAQNQQRVVYHNEYADYHQGQAFNVQDLGPSAT